MKKLINNPESVVEEMLRGMVVLHPGLARLSGHSVLIRADAERVRDRQVAVLSGGGSGHEPAHAGYVGSGMLSAAIAGEVFTSPSVDAVFAAIQAVAGKPGALLVVKNYTGDRLNFGLAAEMARAEGIPVEMILVADDVALLDSQPATAARGLAGTVFVHKLVGAATAEGKSLKEVAAVGRAANEALATMGISLSAGTSPAVGKPSFILEENEIELGLGIHGEPGIRRMELQPADATVDMMLDKLTATRRFTKGARLAIMVNDLGATTTMELAILARRVFATLEERGFTTERMYAGTFLSSLDMAGISISLLVLDDDRLRWLDAATSAPAWPNAARERPRGLGHDVTVEDTNARPYPAAPSADSPEERRLKRAIEAACEGLLQAEDNLTEMDRVTGDGDLGISMSRAARAVMNKLSSWPLEDLPETLRLLGRTLQRELGGSSGPLYGVLFLRCASALKSGNAAQTEEWAEAVDQACSAISELGGAKTGDRTMLDALVPFAQTLREKAGSMKPREAVLAAIAAAEHGANETANMAPRVGRSSYLGERVAGHPDPGAKAVTIWLRAAISAIFPDDPGQGK